jgi:hypothetical protein
MDYVQLMSLEVKTPVVRGEPKSWVEAVTMNREELLAHNYILKGIMLTHGDAFSPSIASSDACEGKPPFFLIEKHNCDPERAGWEEPTGPVGGEFLVVSGIEGVAEFLSSIKPKKLRNERIKSLCTKEVEFFIADDYCSIQMVGEEFLNPCPGWDCMGLMPHEHVDNDFLAWFKKRGKRFLQKSLSSDPVAYRERALGGDGWWKERMAKYREWVASPFPLSR